MLKRILDALNRFIEHNKLSGIIIAFIIYIIVIFISMTELYDVIELKLYDFRFQLKPSVEEWDRLTFLDIDEISVTTLGKFPWPRSYYAKGFLALKDIGVSHAALDIMFPDSSPVHLNSDLYEKLVQQSADGGDISQEDIRNVAVNNDRIFADGIKELGSVILSYTFNVDELSSEKIAVQQGEEFQEAHKRFMELASIPVPKGREKEFEILSNDEIKGISYPIPQLMKTAHSFGFVNRYTDVDGTLRKVRLVRVYNGRIFFNLALAMYIDACGITVKNVEVVPGEKIILKNALNPRNMAVEDVTIPVDENGMVHVNWAGPGPREKSFRIIPFFALLDYFDYAPAVREFFDKSEADRGKFERSKLFELLEKANKEFASVKDNSKRKKAWEDIRKLKKDISNIEKSYYDDLKAETDKIKEELDKSKDPALKEQYDVLLDDLRAIDLVIRTEKLSDNIVLTGLTATGTHDIGTVPMSKEYARVGTYHNTVNTIFQNEYIIKTGKGLNYTIMLLLSLLFGFLIKKFNAKLSILTITVSFLGINIIIISLFTMGNIWVEQLGITLSMLLPSVTIAAVKFLSEESQKRFIKNAFSHYLAPGVIDEIIKNPESLELGGESRNITIFFSDVAGFSTISEKLTPPELVHLLNEYLSEMTDIILGYEGTVDKYEGDAIMAFYGAPQPYEDHAVRACMAAIDMKKRLKELQEDWKARGQDALTARMGMNTGNAVVGNMGSRTRMDYTAMGDSVNLASRLEGANKAYSTHAMISDSTYRAAEDKVEARKLDKIRVVGKSEAVEVFELMGKKGGLPDRIYEMLEKYNQGIENFANREWKAAKSSFKGALKIISDDGPSLTYVKRCDDYIKKPPSKSWDGVYKLTSK